MELLLNTIPRVNAKLQNVMILVVLNTIKMWCLVVLHKLFNVAPNFNFSFTFSDVPFVVYLRTTSDVAVLKEVFLLEEYKIYLDKAPNVIIDLGAHIGDTALYFHTQYPKAQIIAVEPDPHLYQRLVSNVSAIEKIIPIHAAISDERGELSFFSSQRSSLSGSLERRKASDVEIKVPIMTLKELFEKCNIRHADLCKFDIEGGEKNLFTNNPPSAYADAYIGEIHCDLMNLSLESYLAYFNNYNVEVDELPRKGRYNIKAFMHN